MAHVALSNTGDWKLRFEDTQDIRGYRVLDQDGTDTGHTVDEMIVDTEAERVTQIETSDGTRYPANDISIGDGVVYVTGDYPVNDEAVRRYHEMDEAGAVDRQDRQDYDVAVITVYDDDFRRHHASTYEGADYDDDRDAYAYGVEGAYADANRGRTYREAEDDLRTGYASRYADRDYDRDRDAIRTGYHTARRKNAAS